MSLVDEVPLYAGDVAPRFEGKFPSRKYMRRTPLGREVFITTNIAAMYLRTQARSTGVLGS